jgi:hypothetical protein
MTTSPTELMRDAQEHKNGREAEVSCRSCAETWIVLELGGCGLTDEQLKCPVCGEWGAEI